MTKDDKYVPRLAISSWPIKDRPREKLHCAGEWALSDSELLAILLRTGTRGESALDVARKIMRKFGGFRAMSQALPADWRAVKGVGPAKVAHIKAAIEIGRRFGEETNGKKRAVVSSSGDVARLLMPRMRDLKREVVKGVLLTAQNELIRIVDVEEGTVNYSVPLIRTLFEHALNCFAPAVICVHNHPGGDPAPSPEDKHFTSELQKAGNILNIAILDHIIIGDNKYYSFVDQGEL